jgi:hypothetical protein
MALALFRVGGAVDCAADGSMGTWSRMRAAKFSPRLPKNTPVVYEAMGDTVKITMGGADADGRPTHNGWTCKLDGKDCRVPGGPNTDTRSHRKVNDHTLAGKR